MKYDKIKFLFFAVFYLLFTQRLIVFCQELNNKQDINTLIQEGDQLSLKEFNHQKALDKFQQAFKLDQYNYEVLWRLSRTYIFIGRNHPSADEEDKKKRFRMYSRGYYYAQKAIELNPDNTLGFTYRAIANIYIALFKGIWSETGIVKLIKFDCERAISLDPNNHLAYHTFGSIHAKISEEPKLFRWPFGLEWADMEDAIFFYERAISLRPDYILYRLDCAKAYIEEDDFQKAKAHLNTINSLPNQDENDENLRRKAKELYELIKNR